MYYNYIKKIMLQSNDIILYLILKILIINNLHSFNINYTNYLGI